MSNIGKNSLLDELRSVKLYGWRFVSIGHSNVRGLLKHLSEAKILIDETNLDVLTISETHLTEAVLDNEICIAGPDINFYEEIIVEKPVEEWLYIVRMI